MWITKVSLKNPVFATMVMVALCVLGIFSYKRLGVEQLPDISLPNIGVTVLYPGASPEAVENDIEKPIENALNSVSGIKTIRSTSSEGRNETYLEFHIGTDMNRAIQDVRDKLAQVRPTFPINAKDPLVLRSEGEREQPISEFAVTASTRDQRELTEITEQVVIKELQKATGVGRIQAGGERARQIRINVNPQALAGYGIAIDQVMEAIRSANQDVPAGLISNSKTESLVRVEGKIKNLEGFKRIIVARRGGTGGDGPVYLEQVAEVTDGAGELESISRLNGKPAIDLQIYKVQDANIVATGQAVKEAAVKVQKLLPPGVELQLLDASSDFIEGSLTGVKETLLEGGVLTIMIVFLFLRSWRSTIITGVTLPIAVLTTFMAMYAFGFTLNFMTMMALSLCIGLLIDDAIVVRENIVRHIRMGKSHMQAAREGTEEIGLAVMATTFAIVAVFVPVAFMSGIIGKFFYAFGVTVTVAVLVSLFVSFTLDPMLSSIWHDDPRSGILRFAAVRNLLGRVEAIIEWLHVTYDKVLRWALLHRIKTLLLAFAIFVSSILLIGFGVVGTELEPRVDQGWIELRLTTPVGSSLQYADQKAHLVEEEMHKLPEVALVDVDVYGQGRGTIVIDLKLTDRSQRTRSQMDLEKVIRDRLSHIAGLRTSVGFNTPIFLDVIGPGGATLEKIATDLATSIGQVKGVVDLDTSLKPGTPALSVRPIPEMASDLGLTTAAIGNVLRPLVGGENVGYWLGPDDHNYEVRVQLPKSERSAVADIGDLMITTSRLGPDGTPRLVPLRQVTTISETESPQVIKRGNLQRRVGIYANVEGRPVGDASKDISVIVEKQKAQLPPGYLISTNGEEADIEDFASGVLGALALAVIFIYLVLASQFGSFLQPIAIMASLPLSLIGVVLALFLTGTTLNIYSAIGVLMLAGLVSKNAILLVDFANRGQREGLSQTEALLTAGQVRLRPILMTTVAMVFGMLPLAIGLGGLGSELESPMGRAIIGGVITSTLLTLVVVPVIYSYLDVWGRRAAAWFHARGEERMRAAGMSLEEPAKAPEKPGEVAPETFAKPLRPGETGR
jgi:hydrophobe/amphiphile efflux-1 (HAE1) family protein